MTKKEASDIKNMIYFWFLWLFNLIVFFQKAWIVLLLSAFFCLAVLFYFRYKHE